jgi:hypothetical protein
VFKIAKVYEITLELKMASQNVSALIRQSAVASQDARLARGPPAYTSAIWLDADQRNHAGAGRSVRPAASMRPGLLNDGPMETIHRSRGMLRLALSRSGTILKVVAMRLAGGIGLDNCQWAR